MVSVLNFFLSSWKAFLKNKKSFFVFGLLNFFLLGAIYLCIRKRDPSFYPTVSVISIFTITVWTAVQSILSSRRRFYLRHLVCLLLPYSLLLVDLLNSIWKNMAYFLSQVFAYFTVGSIVLIIDIFLHDFSFSRKVYGKIVGAVWDIICSVVLLILLLISFNSLLGNESFDYDAIVAVCQTDFNEAVGYFSRLNHRYILLSLAIATILGFSLPVFINLKKHHECEAEPHSCLIFLFISIFASVVVLALVPDRIYYSNVFKLMSAPVTYFVENRNYKKARMNYDEFISQKLSQEPDNPDASGAFVLIIGESLNRHYMSLYGYSPDTTPFQRQMKEDGTIYLFRYPYSAYAQTIRCIAYMLTDQNQYDNQKKTLQNAISLFDIARYNKFTTRWFSAQGTNLLLDSPTAVLAGSAEYTFSLPMVRSQFDHKITDMDMLKFLPDQLGGKELIIIQLMGSHYPYPHVFPDDFMADSSLSAYEKSVCYNDSVIKEMFQYFQSRNASAILYLSDHSEDVANALGHDPRPEVFTQVMTEIPFWIYISPDYSSKHPGLSERMKRATERVFTSDLIFDLVLSLMNIKCSLTDSTKDVLSDDYFLTRDNARTLGGGVKLQIPSPADGE